MGNSNNDNKNNLTQDQQRQRTGGGGDANRPPQQKGAPVAGNRDQDDHGKLPADRSPMTNEPVGDDKAPQRAPQAGPGKPQQQR